MNSTAKPLAGVKVLDLSRVLAGPYCSMMLGDLGADVIKVERPKVGDETREWGPPEAGGESAYYLCVNRNKRSITVDLKSPEGQEIIRRLAKRSDIVLENYKVGTLQRFGLGYEDLKRVNPSIIYCSITGFGQNGPYKDRPGYDFIIQGMGGIMSITGEPDGPPMKVGVAIVDITAGLFACSAILAALYHREKTGKGQYIDIALLDAMVAWLANVGSNYLVSGEIPKRYGNAHPNIVPYEPFKTKDGTYINIGVGNDRQWKKFCEIAGLEHLADDPRFATNPQRVIHRKELIPIIAEKMLERTADEWLSELEKNKIPCGPINTLDRVFSDPQVLARQMVVEVPHPTASSVKLVASPMKLSETPCTVERHPPLLGEHTDEVLKEIGYSDDDIRQLREKGVI
ncbi:MAG TPA: CoA transferase [Thermodesulforhabdus norvegica]|uniref:CoA transferase n=1 Tax=Thermodesulforhabdus norvegica TaxID=39841 RepID=A0A7C0WUE4_9BACT|nr:CoA transferase [Deltaproteobacteria bacterium]MBW2068506.1 CoA transferase [Deltaproteobacteria bacterium]HDL89755.1 CoA transferase [Thermodesulforhabdus norvegica]